MLTATFASLIAAKQQNDRDRQERIERSMADRSMAQSLADGIRIARIKRIEEMNAQIAEEKREAARKAKERKLEAERKLKAKARNIARNRRDAAVAQILANTTIGTRKDGSRFLRAKAGKGAIVKQAQAEARFQADCARPEHGYPCPPPRRSEAYPQGGLWGKPRDMADIDVKRGEHDRLMKYAETCYNAERPCVLVDDGEVGKVVSLQGEVLGGITLEGKVFVACPSNSNEPVTTHKTYVEALAFVAISPRVRRMMAHLANLDRQIKVLGSETHIRKAGKHCYAERTDARETLSR